MGNVGLLALEDPETGEIVWADTGSKAWRATFQQRRMPCTRIQPGAFAKPASIRINVAANQDYVAPLTRFSKSAIIK